MAYDYSGLVGLAQTVFAINMAYVALGRFRYRAKIRECANNAESLTSEFTVSYVDDRAWHNVQQIAAGNDARAWTIGRMGYRIYSMLFRKPVDIIASYTFAVIAVLTIAWQAYGGIVADDAAGARVWPYNPFLDFCAFVVLAAGAVAPVVFVLAGRYAVRCASRSIEDNMDYLMSTYRRAASEDVNAKLKGLEADENSN